MNNNNYIKVMQQSHKAQQGELKTLLKNKNNNINNNNNINKLSLKNNSQEKTDNNKTQSINNFMSQKE